MCLLLLNIVQLNFKVFTYPEEEIKIFDIRFNNELCHHHSNSFFRNFCRVCTNSSSSRLVNIILNFIWRQLWRIFKICTKLSALVPDLISTASGVVTGVVSGLSDAVLGIATSSVIAGATAVNDAAQGVITNTNMINMQIAAALTTPKAATTVATTTKATG